jgi:hypothetical protein
MCVSFYVTGSALTFQHLGPRLYRSDCQFTRRSVIEHRSLGHRKIAARQKELKDSFGLKTDIAMPPTPDNIDNTLGIASGVNDYLGLQSSLNEAVSSSRI